MWFREALLTPGRQHYAVMVLLDLCRHAFQIVVDYCTGIHVTFVTRCATQLVPLLEQRVSFWISGSLCVIGVVVCNVSNVSRYLEVVTFSILCDITVNKVTCIVR